MNGPSKSIGAHGCVLPIGHAGRCRNAAGTSWENTHPTCERCCSEAHAMDRVIEDRDRARGELARLRAALEVVLAASPGGVEQLRMELAS